MTIDFLNSWGARFVTFAGSMFVQSSLLIGALLLLDLALRRRVRPAVRHALWLVVLVKLAVPPSLAFPSGIGYWLAARPAAPAPALAVSGGGSIRYLDRRVASPPSGDGLKPAEAAPGLAWTGSLLLAEVGVAVALFLVLLHRSRRVARWVAQASPAPDGLVEMLRGCAKGIGLRHAVRLRLSDQFCSPAVCGLWRPVVLLPRRLAERLDRRQLRDVLLHELAHVRRRDVGVNHAQALLQVVYWWHPLLWFANARLRRLREEAADDAARVALGREAESYPRTLLAVAKLALRRPMLALGLVGILESRSAVGGRIRRMLDLRPPRSAKVGVGGCALVVAVAAVAVPMAPGPRGTAAQPLVTHTYKVDSDTFQKNLLKAVPNRGEMSTTELARRCFRSLGVNTNAPASFHFNDHTGVLYVRAAPEAMDLIDQAVERLAGVAPEVMIESRFLAPPRSFLRRTGLDTGHRRNVVGILTRPQAQAFLKAAEQTGGIDVLSAPRVITESGRQAQVLINQVPSFNVGIVPAALHRPGVHSSNGVARPVFIKRPVPLGPRLDVVPTVAAGSYAISVKVTPSLTEFVGYAAGGKTRRVWVDGKAQEVAAPLPRFRVRTGSATAILWPGQSLVLTGFSDRLEAATPEGLSEIGNYSGSKETQLVVLITAHLVDAAGNPLNAEAHPPDRFDRIPPQPKAGLPRRPR